MAKVKEGKKHRTEITFTKAQLQKGSITVEGADLSKSPDKIRKLMDLLDLPEGTNATVTLIESDVIVR